MKKIFLSFCLLFSLSAFAEKPVDPRLQTKAYSSKEITNIVTNVGFVSMIEFAEDEFVSSAEIGFPSGYSITINDNIVFVKPIGVMNDDETALIDPNSKDWATNLAVRTNKRSYIFSLEVIDEETVNKKDLTFSMVFDYPEERRKQELEQKRLIDEANKLQAEIRREENNNRRINHSLANEAKPKNYNYFQRIGEKSQDIVPSFAYDDGEYTYIGFSSEKIYPSVFSTNSSGEEQIINTHTINRDGFSILVIQSIGKEFILRSGDMVVGLYNKSYRRASGPLSKTGTKSKDVQRVVQ